jgi:peptidyl-prolyl cis-trans isomerase A (cyclophilin A)
MIRSAYPLALLWLAPVAASAQTVPPTPPAPPVADAPAAPRPATAHVSLQTALGPIVIEVETERAPVTAANFLRYVAQKRFDGTAFYRAVKVAPGYGLLQGGTRNNPKRILPPIAHEATTATKLSHTDGAVSMARGAPGTADGDFFIVVGGFPSMDADPTQTGDNQGYAVFGHVSEGMDIVRQLILAPVSPTEGEGDLKGQMLSPTIPIVNARRTD